MPSKTFHLRVACAVLCVSGLVAVPAFAQSCPQTLPPPLVTFCKNTPAQAAEVNQNFNVLAQTLISKTGGLSDGGTTTLDVGVPLRAARTLDVAGATTLENGLTVTGTANASAFGVRVVTAGGTAAFSTSTGNTSFATFADLTVTFTVPVQTTVQLNYQISYFSPLGQHLVTRLMVDGAEDLGGRSITGTSDTATFYGTNSATVVRSVSAGTHTVTVEYRTPSAINHSPGTTDHQTRRLTALIFGS